MEKFNDGYYHEAMDRLYVIQNMIEDFLLSHPACERHPEIAQKVEEAQKLLGQAYQNFGQYWDNE
jgi:hypothetical protein